MKTGFYTRLAWDGIRKNKRLYFPYILTGSVMVTMFYILGYLAESPALSGFSGGSVIMSIMPLGSAVIGIFSLLFLFYTNSFLIRQRYREFGLYNVLGMDKRNISRIMFREALTVGTMAIGSGLIIGVALSKTAELGLFNLAGLKINYRFSVGVKALWQTALVFAAIYFVLLLNSLIKVKLSKPLELMKAGRVGEKIPKRTWIYTVIGVIFLGSAYYLAISIKEPLAALSVFFAAVVLVIGGTYMLFMSGSVVLCRLLQKNKKYYYSPNHFVSVSSMVYRMKRNGAGLASICILLTMVLVMISSTASLYFGSEDALDTRYPKGVNIKLSYNTADGISDENAEHIEDIIIKNSAEYVRLSRIRTGSVPGLINDDGITVNYDPDMDFSLSTYNNIGYLSVISLDDYNSMSENAETLGDGECLIYYPRGKYTADTFTVENGKPYKVKKVLGSFISSGDGNSALIVPTVYMVVKDFAKFAEPMESLKNSDGDPMIVFNLLYGFDMESADSEMSAASAIKNAFRNENFADGERYSVESRESNRADFFQTFGGLFFLGIMLSIVFLLAAVLIIYYKQISEGYEDRSRFEIMKKVGMTKRDIRKSINSQILTVFFSPLVFAGIHMCFAFPFIWKMLIMFNLSNMPFIIAVMAVCFAVFGLFYALVYKITSNSYYAIVNDKK